MSFKLNFELPDEYNEKELEKDLKDYMKFYYPTKDFSLQIKYVINEIPKTYFKKKRIEFYLLHLEETISKFKII